MFQKNIGKKDKIMVKRKGLNVDDCWNDGVNNTREWNRLRRRAGPGDFKSSEFKNALTERLSRLKPRKQALLLNDEFQSELPPPDVFHEWYADSFTWENVPMHMEFRKTRYELYCDRARVAEHNAIHQVLTNLVKANT